MDGRTAAQRDAAKAAAAYLAARDGGRTERQAVEAAVRAMFPPAVARHAIALLSSLNSTPTTHAL